MHKALITFLLFAVLFSSGCDNKETASLLIYNGNIHTMDTLHPLAEAVAARDGRILALGSLAELEESYEFDEKIDAEGNHIYPGLIDSHCHFYGYGLQLGKVNLMGTKSFAEVVARIIAHREKYPDAAWITGRGWDQTDWETNEWPDRAVLDSLFADVPVLVRRVDGHAALANGLALQLAGIDTATRVAGGSIMVIDGSLTGVLLDNAVDKVLEKIPAPGRHEMVKALLSAQKDCFGVGLTTVADAGLSKETVLLMDSLHKSGELQMRIYAMLDPSAENKDYFFQKGILKTERLNVRSFKMYSDGALGSRGACLLRPYADAPGETGFLLSAPGEMLALAKEIYANGFQLNTHSIGDSANRTVLDIYAKVLGEYRDSRWRIEHAQVVNAEDVAKYGRHGIIPSVQPVHATSDMKWIVERLGTQRAKEAYAYRDLYRSAGTIALGSDFPVEHINPLFGFHAAVTRQGPSGLPSGGFQMENSLDRETALRGMTIMGAYAAFEENEKGSIEVGKVADFVILDTDLLNAEAANLRNAKVITTIVGGIVVYSHHENK